MTTTGFAGGWIASLSDGSTVYESKPIKGERTPWQLLLERCRTETHETTSRLYENGHEILVPKTVPLRITMLRMQYGPVMIMAMPQQMCDGYFQAREATRVVFRDYYIHMQGIGSIVGDMVFITWIELLPDNQFQIRSDIRPLSACKVHTTIS